MPEVALRFVADNQPKSRIPFVKHIRLVDLEKTNLTIVEKDKLKNRKKNHGVLEDCLKSINKSNQIRISTINEVENYQWSKSKEIDVVTYNIKNLEKQDVQSYLQNIVRTLLPEANGSLLTHIRRLATAYDLYENGDLV